MTTCRKQGGQEHAETDGFGQKPRLGGRGAVLLSGRYGVGDLSSPEPRGDGALAVNLSVFTGSDKLRASWFDPRTGESPVFAIFPNKGRTTVVPPAQGKGCDWVLVLEEA